MALLLVLEPVEAVPLLLDAELVSWVRLPGGAGG